MHPEIDFSVQVGTETDWIAIVAGRDALLAPDPGGYTCGLRGTGTLWCWGAPFYFFGSDADRRTMSRTTPQIVVTVADFTALDGRSGSVCMLRSTGDLMCFGDNTFGQLGDGSGWSATFAPVK